MFFNIRLNIQQKVKQAYIFNYDLLENTEMLIFHVQFKLLQLSSYE